MRIINDNGVYVRDIHSALNNICTNQNIIFFVDEIENMFFQFVTFHLPVCITDTQIRAKTLYNARHFCQSEYTVENKKYLPATLRLIIHRIANEVFVIPMQFRLYRLPVWRRCINNTQIAGAHQAEL